ncbi:transcription factor GTE10 isoform X1 [Ziziphus jujuba]|uniref:Transcription factor GTE10 isoform X1 n=1 Tax=Ziziphus jujuba TaxID=326968 RepID=A0A6P4A9C7_ZIZJJ|nr:transcription factor GTE10 isoform X1 [Ziziphus jujuba]XP_048329357.2 transcription factor GTE10 isoform X1 [Ziziphus jujuba]
MAPTVPIEFAGQKESRKFSLSQTMGKSRKYSGGHSSGFVQYSKGHSSTGFVPDYRHAAVETMGESEGFGSSGRVDVEMTASEDSFAPKRKSISLNMNGYDSFGVPMQVLSFSRMSRSERKDLEMKLKMELEQIRTLQTKVESLSTNVVVLSPSSDIRSCSDGKKRPPLESIHRLPEVSAPPSNKKAPPGRNGQRTKRSSSGRFELVKSQPPAKTSIAMLMKQCENLLMRMMSHQYAWVFNTPVDIVKLNIPDYFTVIKHPMDFSTVKGKIASGQYSSPLGFADDIRLTFSNAMTYNPPGNDVHVMAATLSKYFEVRWKAIEKKLQVSTDVQLLPSRVDLQSDTGTTDQLPPSKKKKITPPVSAHEPETVRQIINQEEKDKLSNDLEAYMAELPENIISFLKAHCDGQGDEDEIEIDMDALGNDNLIVLRKLLDEYVLEKQKAAAKAEPCEMELLNESGLSNSSMQPCKGNDTVDEDVDVVGGNDPPISTFPPVEIEKDAAHRNSKCNSSSSESGSSSSDSDSASSSESESNAVKASVPDTAAEEKLNSGPSLDQKRSDLGDSEIGNHLLNEEAQVEQNSNSKPLSVEVDNLQEGESAPSERQVSPEKLYRAAILRRRFADTILKAREKALEKGEKRDPEKLRKEREELERRQKEEKARLQAEAKAAEEARKKAEEDAAAEARKKRESEREAARQALQLMEKTVDINENSQFMEDLELLRVSGDEQLPTFMDEASPELSQNGLGSFKMQGNPLEQLGLYMKDDEEDEEEEGLQAQELATEQTNDVEEGEID